MMFRHSVRVPRDRIGVLIGRDGSVKSRIEAECNVELKIDSKTGDVEINPSRERPGESDLATALRIVEAISHGFSPNRAFKLLEPGVTLSVIDLREYAGKSREDLERIKGRIIGHKGKARRVMEELTGAEISVYGRVVAIIGTVNQVKLAEQAVRMLASGSMHKTVYNMLQRARSMARFEKLRLWRSSEEEELT